MARRLTCFELSQGGEIWSFLHLFKISTGRIYVVCVRVSSPDQSHWNATKNVWWHAKSCPSSYSGSLPLIWSAKRTTNEWFYRRRAGEWGKRTQLLQRSVSSTQGEGNASNHLQGPRNVTSTKTFQNRHWVVVDQPDYYSRPYSPIQDPTTPHQNSTTGTCCKGNRYSSNKKEVELRLLNNSSP